MKLAYRHDLYEPNQGKIDKLLALYEPFHKASRTVSLYWLHRLETGEILPAHVRIPGKVKLNGLSARQMNSVGLTCKTAISSWLELLAEQVKHYISHSSLPTKSENPLAPSERMILYRINKHHLWWMQSVTLYWRIREGKHHEKMIEPCGQKTDGAFPLDVDSTLLKLSRRMVKQARKNISFPNLNRMNTLILEEEVAKVERPEHTTSPVSWWVKISTLTSRKPVLVGLKRNTYFEQEYATTLNMKNGKRCRIIQLHRDPKTHMLSISLVCERPDMQPRITGVDLGVDYGMADALIALSNGRLYGHAMLNQLKRLDARLMIRQKFLQFWNIPYRKDQEYQQLQKRIRDFVANEIGRILNRIAIEHGTNQVQTLVLEELDFRYGGMSRTMNRLITRIGRNILKQRLAMLTAKHGITIITVPSQYTSLECSGCGYTNKRNRPNRGTFKCRFCGKTLHADINAARIILSRRSWHQPDNTGLQARNNTLQLLEQRHRQRWCLPDTWSGPERSRRSGSPLKPHIANEARSENLSMSYNDTK